jgi:predicted RNA-binding protein YlxR (DUF448 family)
VNNKTTSHQKRVPQRTCVGCRIVQPKRTLIRIVSSLQGVRIDPTGRAAGRGAYLHNSRSCWKKGINGKLAQALKVEISKEDLVLLSAFLETLPVDENVEKSAEVT